jgi:hypothetical protein
MTKNAPSTTTRASQWQAGWMPNKSDFPCPQNSYMKSVENTSYGIGHEKTTQGFSL